MRPLERRSRPLAAFRRYYPGFLGAAFLVLLRLAIGWHFLSEGLYKIMSTSEGKASILSKYLRPTDGPPFSSEAYLRASTGPWADDFRRLIPDVESRDALDLNKLKDAWAAEMQGIGGHFGFDEAQREAAGKRLTSTETIAGAWFADPENRQKISKYLDDIDSLARVEAKPGKMSFEVERAIDARKSLEKDRKGLVGPINGWTKDLHDAIEKLVKPEQVKQSGAYKPVPTDLQNADRITMVGLSLAGLGLMLGLFTPIAALGGAAFLMLFYLSMPPFPGLPESPQSEGHYVYVNKNMIEFLACLVLATTPSGLWFGVDALLFGWIGRARARRALARATADSTDLSSASHASKPR